MEQATKKKDASAGQDSVSAEPWEIEYVHRQLPTFSYEEVTQVLEACKKSVGSDDRDKIVECIRAKLA